MKPVTIIGGGLAGLTLGIQLRTRGVPVTLFEAGKYPRHRVCGEFISGRGGEILNHLGLRETFLKAGAVEARTVAFFAGKARSPVRELPEPALCLSRFVMDTMLADKFAGAGGELRHERWREGFGEGIVCATGRRVQAVDKGWRWFGLKVHARGVALEADLEMHLAAGGYVGLCRLGGGGVNICGLFRRQPGADAGPPPFDLLRGTAGTFLHEKLAGADFMEDSFCSVAGLWLRPHRALETSECRIGDALTMIPPVTGNGMSLAFESAGIAAGPLAAYGRGEISWPRAQQDVARTCDGSFARRLAWARWLQALMFSPMMRTPAGALLLRRDGFWKMMFEKTR